MKMINLIALCILLVNCNSQAQLANRIRPSVEFQQAQSDRIETPLVSTDSTYRFKVLPGDVTHNGNRAEAAFKFDNQNNNTYNYSWDFKFDGRFNQTAMRHFHSIIAQWLNGPETKGDWKGIKGQQLAPVNLIILKDSVDKLTLNAYYGLTGSTRQLYKLVDLVPNKWYHIDAKILWSQQTNGYALITINNSTFTFKGANKYNSQSNIFKLGIYRNRQNTDTTQTFVKNVTITKLTNTNQ